MSYEERLAKKNSIPYIQVERIYLGDNKTYIESNSKGNWRLVSPNAILETTPSGMHISGNVTIDSNLRVKSNIECDYDITADKIISKEKLV